MSTEPNLDYPNPKRLEGLMRAFDSALRGKHHAHLMVEQIGKTQPLKRPSLLIPPTITNAQRSLMFLPHQSRARRRLTPLYMYRYIRDTIRLRKYNEAWLKNNKP